MPPRPRYQPIDGDELYRRLATGQPLMLLDVRTLAEFEEQHIPGSELIPLHDLEGRVGELPDNGTPIAVICEAGQRSLAACRFLAEHDLGPLYNLEGGLLRWPGPVRRGEPGANGHRYGYGLAPSSFLVENFELLPRGLALDVAMGQGRNAIYLAARGFDVDGVDSDPRSVAAARAAARKLGTSIRAIVGNLEDGTYHLPFDTYDVVTVFNFLHRPLLDDIRQGVVPGGVVVYQTYTVEQARYGRPRNPDHLLQPGELKQVFGDWEVLRYREFTGPSRRGGAPRALAGIVARKPR